MADRPRIALLMGPGESSTILYNAVQSGLGIVGVVQEPPTDRRAMVRRRVKRLGPVRVGGQLAFQLLAAPLLARRAEGRVAAIVAEHGLDLRPIPPDRVTEVASVNTPEAVAALRQLAPDVVLVNGTRIISKATLEGVGVPFVNTHTGVTPAFRGVHGGYWALAEQRPELCGVTVHLVDTGIDTGPVLAQALIRPGPEDSFPTYRFLQLAAAIPCLLRVLPEVAAGRARPIPPLSSTSRLYSHPTLGQYLGAWWMYGVR